MRFTRILLLIVAAAAIAGAASPSAGAQAFEDNSCPYIPGTLIKKCPDGFTGKPYSYQIAGRPGAGCWPHVTFKAIGTLPPGITLSTGGVFSGTPTQAGEYTFWVAMQDIPHEEGGVFWCFDRDSTEELFRITVWQGLQIVQSQSTLAPGQLNTPYNLQFTATGGGNPTWTVSSGSLPAGITLNSSTGLLSGTPTATGNFSFKITAAEGGRTDTQTYSMSVVEPLRIARPALFAEVGLASAIQFSGTGGRGPYTWSATTLPNGLTLDQATGLVSGVPAVAGKTPVKVTVKDALGLTTTIDVNLTVAQRLALKKKAAPVGTVGGVYSFLIPRVGGVGPFKFVVVGPAAQRASAGLEVRAARLPAGLKLNAKTGRITGKPQKAGTYSVRVQVTDRLGAKSAATYTLKVVS